VVRRRVGDQRVGFTTEVHATEVEDCLRLAQSVDFVEYGFEPEFIGRLPVSVVCADLNSEDLFKILKYSEGSFVRQVEEAFRGYGMDVVFTDEALRCIAEKAAEEKTGARALVSVMERTLRHFKFELPSSAVKKLVITPEVVQEPMEQLELVLSGAKPNERLMNLELIRRYEKVFKEKNGIAIHFDEEALEHAADLCTEQGKDPAEFCEELLQDYQYGLVLVKRNTGQEEFVLGKAAIDDPTGVLNEWIRQSVESAKAAKRDTQGSE
jgi:ATP-dependent protease Clp ATPase subunit